MQSWVQFCEAMAMLNILENDLAAGANEKREESKAFINLSIKKCSCSTWHTIQAMLLLLTLAGW